MAFDFVFLSLARNCAPTIPRFLELLDALQAEGLAATAIIGENGSSDGTGALLKDAERSGRIMLVPTDFMAAEPERLRRMALGRERLRTTLLDSGIQARFVCVLDLDNVLTQPPSVAALLSAAAKLERADVFAVSATSRPHYYDLLAFQDEGRSFDTLLDELSAKRGNIFGYYGVFRRRIYPHQRALTSDGEITCASAFNGLCLYEAATYGAGSYLQDGPRTCEHIVFNRRLAAATGTRMLIDPGLVLATPDDHRAESFAPFAWRRLKKLAALYRDRR